jgi:hypothetical protein
VFRKSLKWWHDFLAEFAIADLSVNPESYREGKNGKQNIGTARHPHSLLIR